MRAAEAEVRLLAVKRLHFGHWFHPLQISNNTSGSQSGSSPSASMNRANQNNAHKLKMSFSSAVSLEVIKAIITGGIAGLVFVTGQAVQRFVIEPAVDMRKLIAQIAHDLVFYRNCFSSPSVISDEEWDVATTTYRRHAASLRSLPLIVPFYDRLAPWLHLPSKQQAGEASAALIGISNTPRSPEDYDFAFKNERFAIVHRSLNIPVDS